ncbi:FAD-dependent monooxygenase [Streptomyces sp. NBC_00557]|uniref:FAD-dependent monooxygenase n=1 Tax=Streptomyces sp. NBC_00557 TaxID=2975776 RepID=UPI002E80090C|nr:FAD-dependent monooxygenase [Streptomyces sp. NBC_00557]WUC40196.1 FAD-dependent monooxygenase [Streptomyces sp. NBC_00557]
MREEAATDALRGRSVLISGTSVAGPALAYWLTAYGCSVTLVEKAPALRRGGFAVDLRGSAHRTVLRRMGLWEEVRARQTHMGAQCFLGPDGREQARLSSEFMSGDVEIFRGDLSEILYEHTRDRAEYVFGDSIAVLEQTPDAVHVTFEHGAPRTFDLVVGADGLHSNVRRLVFGDEPHHLRFLGHYVAVYDAPNHLGLDRCAQWFNAPGRALCLGHYGGDPATCLVTMVFAEPDPGHARLGGDRQRALLAERYAGLGWEVPRALKALQEADDVYFDAMAQVRVDRFSEGRVVLLGDAGYGATMGGLGTGLALVCAYVLAGELAMRAGHHRGALAAYEERIRAYALGCQKNADSAGRMLAPATARGIRGRNLAYRVLQLPVLAGYFSRLSVRAAENIDLEDYSAALHDARSSRSRE